jgi:predicted nucleic acid-binding protein
LKALAAMTALPAHDHWSEAPPALQMATLNSLALVGHRHVTDAYLLGLAAHQGQCLATLDKGLESHARAGLCCTHRTGGCGTVGAGRQKGSSGGAYS